MPNSTIPPTLAEHLTSGLCVPWCGAGVSIPSGLPSWNSLVEALIDAAANYGLASAQEVELRDLMATGAYEDVVEFCRDHLGEGEYRTYLERMFSAARTPTPLHDRVAGWRVPAILTSNYDRLIETALTRRTGHLANVLTGDDVQTLWRHFSRGEFFLLKVHGDIVRPATVVLTMRDYTRHVFGNLPFMTFLQRLVLSRSLLFIGSSLNDLYIRRLLEETTFLTGGIGMPHFALLPNPGPIRARLLRDRFNIIALGYDPAAYNGSHETAILKMLDGIEAMAGPSLLATEDKAVAPDI
jgi:hypothetical protein